MGEIFSHIIRDEIIKLRQHRCYMKVIDLIYDIEENMSILDDMVYSYREDTFIGYSYPAVTKQYKLVRRRITLLDGLAQRYLENDMIDKKFYNNQVKDFVHQSEIDANELYALAKEKDDE